MTLDDRSLREHLERRAQAGAVDVTALTEAVVAGSSAHAQVPGWRRIDSRFLGIGIAAAVAVSVLGAVTLLPPHLWPSPGASTDASPGVSPDASPRATAGDLAGYPAERALTTDELFAAVLDQPQAQVGTLLIADVEIHVLPTSCVPGASECGLYFVRTPARVASLHVIGTERPQGRATYAFRVASGPELELVGSVDPGPNRFAWTLPRLTDALAASNELVSRGRLVLADGWLGSLNGSPYCPLASPRQSGGLDPFGCGQASWVIPDGYSIGPIQRGFKPEFGLRLPNNMGALGNPHGFWLIKPIGFPSDCFLCPPAGAATLIGRVDPIRAPIQPDPSSMTAGIYPIERALTAAELAAYIEEPWFDQAGPIVIADVALSRAPEVCGTDYACPRYSIAVPGRADPILVWDDRAAGPTTPAPAGPIAYRVKTDVPGFDLIGPVRPSEDGLAWTLPRLAPLLPGIRSTGSGDHPLLLVDGWLKTVPDLRLCPLIPPQVPAAPDFTQPCGQPFVWLLPDESVGSDVPQPTWVRVPYHAMPETSGLEPVHGYWLIDPSVSDGCVGCTLAGPADLIGRVHSLDELRAWSTPGEG